MLPRAALGDPSRGRRRRRPCPWMPCAWRCRILSLGRKETRGRRDDARSRRFRTIVGAVLAACANGERPVARSRRSRTRGALPPSTFGAEPPAERSRALETYLNTVCDHGLNASTFAARVIVSTRSDVISAITARWVRSRAPCTAARRDLRSTWSSRSGRGARARPSIRGELDRGEAPHGIRTSRVPGARSAGGCLARAAERFLCERRRPVASMTWPERRDHGAAPAAQFEARSAAGHERRVLHRAVTAWPRLPSELFTATFAVGRVSRRRRIAWNSFATAG
jgi:hypothetical protein